MFFKNFSNSFVLNKPRGQCTKHQLEGIEDDGRSPDEDLLSYCVCCGDDYNPDPLMNCPLSPWKNEGLALKYNIENFIDQILRDLRPRKLKKS